MDTKRQDLETEASTPPRTTAILAIILLSYFMVLLDNSVIFTALPSIKADLGLGAVQLSWVQDAYTLVFGGLLLLGARAGDLLGRRRVFVAGLIVFSVASLLVGLAQEGWWMIAARALQGVGAAIVAPSSLSLITASFPAGRERSRAIALYGATAGIGASLGLLVGGAFTQWISWRAGFFINVPIGLAMILLAPRYLPESVRARGRFDLIGALCATLGLGALVFAFIHAAQAGWRSPATLGSLAAGVLLIAVLVLNESRTAQPIMPLHLFASRARTGGYLGRMLYMGAMIGFFFFTTQYLQEVLGFTPLQAGAGFLPMTVVNFAVALLIPRITRRVGLAVPLIGGVVLTLAGMAWLSRVAPDADYLLGVALPMICIGAGQGLVFAPLTSAGLSGIAAGDAGAASGLVNAFHQVGMSLGLGILVLASTTVDAAETPEALLSGQVSAALTVGSVLLGLCLVACLALILPAERAGKRNPSRQNTSKQKTSIGEQP
ncbi:MFS transporter [Paeniglutamicibacter sp. NPDC012692]|uniref:MFS transporter n=1 Tax=Paeniglutamicibacter sp. NPDC012692 TaxID=3364388 RepID=UPI003692187A